MVAAPFNSPPRLRSIRREPKPLRVGGETGGPPVRPGASLGDIVAGLFTAIGILAAVHDRARSGKGQMLDMSMLDCQVAVLENAFARYFATGDRRDFGHLYGEIVQGVEVISLLRLAEILATQRD